MADGHNLPIKTNSSGASTVVSTQNDTESSNDGGPQVFQHSTTTSPFKEYQRDVGFTSGAPQMLSPIALQSEDRTETIQPTPCSIMLSPKEKGVPVVSGEPVC
ncbi:hypothetical protein CRE_22780 [Caenorhabditis remanei]|uniref:Uncharacterized protein n=1 Tax=Caenorhabditis remanei TaxID=31234 RepID=E3MHH2_CAERE|nr:hypothetical protein CRE_22780 [Caenorhabditis remanei]